MIRRDDEGGFLLITQHDHALISGELAEQFGNEVFATPEPRESVMRGIRLHDCGWPLHDDAPTINKTGLPLDVFECPREIALKVWAASAERAGAEDPYAGLLVSLHVLNLSVFVTTQVDFEGADWDMNNPPDRFAVIKFQQREIELQEQLRMQLGLRTDRPTHHKHPHESDQKREDQLNFNFRLLQAMDVISLAACCTKPPTLQTQDILPKPGAAPIRLTLARHGKDLMVDPWPFATKSIELMIPACRIPQKKYANNDELRTALAAGMGEVVVCRVLPNTR
jgi:hypothetical protein